MSKNSNLKETLDNSFVIYLISKEELKLFSLFRHINESEDMECCIINSLGDGEFEIMNRLSKQKDVEENEIKKIAIVRMDFDESGNIIKNFGAPDTTIVLEAWPKDNDKKQLVSLFNSLINANKKDC